jgi:regulator of protease activity HflC (stomatin/prohibitin superfamily)
MDIDRIDKTLVSGAKIIVSISFLLVFIVIISALVGISPFTMVGAGEQGVVLRWGAVTGEVFDEGFHWKVPVMERVVKMDVKTQKVERQATSASKDLQILTTDVAIKYHLDREQVAPIYKRLRRDYEDRIISPSIQEAVKASTALFNAEEVVTKRPEVKGKILQILKDDLKVYDIIVEDVNIINFKFSEAYDHAIEQKQVAEQNALRAERVLRQVEIEAQQKVVKAEATRTEQILLAEAKAEALRIQREQISDEMIRFEAINSIYRNGLVRF